MSKKSIQYLFTLMIFFVAFLTFAPDIFAQNKNYGLYETSKTVFGQNAVDKSHPAVIVGLIIRYVLTLLGVVFFVLVFRAGILWMTARGNSEDVEHAKSLLINASIGLVIVLAAYAITTFAVNQIIDSITPQETDNTDYE